MPVEGSHLVHSPGKWEIDLARGELRQGGAAVFLGGRAFEIVAVLAQAAGELVTKDDLMRRVWPGAIVGENAIQVHISAIRKALGSDRDLLKTVSGRGYRLLGAWAPIEAPRARVRPHDKTSKTHSPERNNLPAATADVIGREAALEELGHYLTVFRAITLVGVGGIGKTTLAIECARASLAAFPDGVWLVEFVSVSNPALVPSTIAGVLGVASADEDVSIESVARAIGTNRLLLVLDNCEHVIDVAACVAETLIRMCPQLRLLATSREVLRIHGEHAYRVPPLDLPPDSPQNLEELLRHGAAALFVARTQALRSEFAPRGTELAMVAAICKQLDGIPLALEFAAARAATLGLQEVTSRLNDRFGLLTDGRRTSLPRHQTLRATFDWSYELLSPSERSLLRHLAIFPAGFSIEAATTVAGVLSGSVLVVDGIANLVAKSLVILDSSTHSGRWRLLETVRAYGLEKLAEAGEADAASRRHAEFYCQLLEPVAPSAKAPFTLDDMVNYGRELDNVRAALDWATSPNGDLKLGVNLTAACIPMWVHLSLMPECRDRIEHALNVLESGSEVSDTLRMQLQIALGTALSFTMGPSERAKLALAGALRIARDTQDVIAQLRALWALWIIQLNTGDCRAARLAAEGFASVADSANEPALIAVADRLVGCAIQHSGGILELKPYFERALKSYVAPRDHRFTYWLHYDQRVLARAMLARSLLLQGLLDQAIEQARRSLGEANETHDPICICEVLRLAVCPIEMTIGNLVTAEHAVRRMIDVATSHSAPFWRNVGLCLEGKLHIERGDFAKGVELLDTTFVATKKAGWAVWYPEFLGSKAQGLAALGDLAGGLATIDEALTTARRSGETYYVGELLRIKGEILVRGSIDQERDEQLILAAENCWQEGLALSRQQSASLWELRLAMCLARLRAKQDREPEAKEIVFAVYSRFTEGFETDDLREASAMLRSLSA